MIMALTQLLNALKERVGGMVSRHGMVIQKMPINVESSAIDFILPPRIFLATSSGFGATDDRRSKFSNLKCLENNLPSVNR